MIQTVSQQQENILLSLKKHDYLSRSQLQKLHRLGSVRNANRILKNMSHLLNSFRDTENIYYLNKDGREIVEATKICQKTPLVQHNLMRTDLYLFVGCPTTWKKETALTIENANFKMVCDAIFIKDKKYNIVEIDYTQKMINNKSKIEKQRQLLQFNVFEVPPVFIWVTTTEYRRKQLLKMSQGLNVQVYLHNEIN